MFFEILRLEFLALGDEEVCSASSISRDDGRVPIAADEEVDGADDEEEDENEEEELEDCNRLSDLGGTAGGVSPLSISTFLVAAGNLNALNSGEGEGEDSGEYAGGLAVLL